MPQPVLQLSHAAIYQRENLILSEVNVTIEPGDFVYLIGKTGSGKSTLVDLLIGLIKPNKGTITVDKKDINENLNSWKKILGYVPQDLYLLDDSIQKTVIFPKNSE